MEEKKLTMKDYVIETPETVLQNIDRSKSLTQSLVEEYLSRETKRIWIVACGSSYNGSLCAQSFLTKILKKDVRVIPPFTFVNYENNFSAEDFIVVCSQSGRSTNAIEALELLKSKGHRAIGITGDIESDFKEICDLTIDWGVGIEKVGMVTKGVVTLALYFMLFAIEAAERQGILSTEEKEAWKAEMRKAMAAHKELQASAFQFIEGHKKDLLSMKGIWLISAGSNLATCVEGALKIGESVKLHASAYEVEEFLHGPVFPLNPDYTVIAIDSNDRSSKRIHQVYHAVKTVTDRAYLVTGSQTDDPDAISTSIQLPEEINPLAYLAVCPLLAEFASEALATKMHPLYGGLREAISTKSNKKPWK